MNASRMHNQYDGDGDGDGGGGGGGNISDDNDDKMTTTIPSAQSQCVLHFKCTYTLRSNANSILSINITKGTKLIIVHGTSSKCIWSVLFAMYFIYRARFACVCVSNASAEKLYNYLWIELQAQRSNTKTRHTQHLCSREKKTHSVRAI